MWYTVSATNAAAVCQRWFRDQLCRDLDVQAKAEEISAYKLIEGEASKAPAGSGRHVPPLSHGGRSPYWDPFLRGSFTGISMGATRASSLARFWKAWRFRCAIVLAPSSAWAFR
jgi:xylulokinase